MNLARYMGLAAVAVGVGLAAYGQESPKEQLFQRLFGTSGSHDRAAEVLALEPDGRLELDTDGDGRVDELWYLDTAKRHYVEPLLVRVVDEDGDMAEDGRGDRDSDLWFYDWDADGSWDGVIDYEDQDGDNDVDAMGIFFGPYNKRWNDDYPDVRVWWGVDTGDDNLLWYDVNGTYHQPDCQYRSHFGGNESFYQFKLTPDDAVWMNIFEDPFAFFDPDGDGASEEVVRICALGHEVENLRYSIDADGDAAGRNPQNYDFSITALPGKAGVHTRDVPTAPLEVRGVATHPVLGWAETRAFSRSAPWGQALLTWDELNANTEGDFERDPNERWEGIINHAAKDGTFPQVGGPPTSPYNKRVEISDGPVSPLQLYYDPADRRLHLLGANRGYLDVDYDLDGTVDMAYSYEDTDGDGILDLRRIDIDADGTFEAEWPLAGPQRTFPLEYTLIAPFYRGVLASALTQSQTFIDAARAALGDADASADAVEAFFLDDLPGWLPERAVGAFVRSSPAGARYYTDLVRDRLFFALREQHGGNAGWDAVESAYAVSDFAQATDALRTLVGRQLEPIAVPAFEGMARRVAITVEGPANGQHVPAAISVAAIRDKAPDFNPAHCAVVADARWLDWLEVPHQVDDLGKGEELAFLADLPENGEATYFVYYSPEGARELAFPRLTGAVLDTPAYVAWESEYGAFRFYTGQFDFFGKQVDRLLPKPDRLIYPLIDVNYHAEQDWGIDALHVGTTSGLGGLTLTLDGADYLVQSPAGEGHVDFDHRVLAQGPVRAAVEITATNVVPENADLHVVMTAIVYAEHAESEIRATVHGGEGRDVVLTPGVMKLEEEQGFTDEANGVAGCWGYQGDDIGEIGLGIVVPKDRIAATQDLDHERRIACTAPNGQLTYWIVGDWRRGRQYPVEPNVDTWHTELKRLAKPLQTPVTVTVAE